jgi:hypothetical protein
MRMRCFFTLLTKGNQYGVKMAVFTGYQQHIVDNRAQS